MRPNRMMIYVWRQMKIEHNDEIQMKQNRMSNPIGWQTIWIKIHFLSIESIIHSITNGVYSGRASLRVNEPKFTFEKTIKKEIENLFSLRFISVWMIFGFHTERYTKLTVIQFSIWLHLDNKLSFEPEFLASMARNHGCRVKPKSTKSNKMTTKTKRFKIYLYIMSYLIASSLAIINFSVFAA